MRRNNERKEGRDKRALRPRKGRGGEKENIVRRKKRERKTEVDI